MSCRHFSVTSDSSDTSRLRECLNAVLQPRRALDRPALEALMAADADRRTPNRWSRIQSWISTGRLQSAEVEAGAVGAAGAVTACGLDPSVRG